MKRELEYPLEIRPLAKDEGGGWLITYSELPGCMSDGETPEEAIANGRDAVIAWLKAERHDIGLAESLGRRENAGR